MRTFAVMPDPAPGSKESDSPRASAAPATHPTAARHRFQHIALSNPATRTPAVATPSDGLASVIQPAWHHVQSGTKVRKLNLKNNQDGTWTHSSTGSIFKDTGAKHTDGSPLLQPSGATTPTPSTTTTTGNTQNVLFRVLESGKIDYLPNTPTARSTAGGKYLEMGRDEFSIFKAGGKRTPSDKIMDPVTLKKYAYDETGKQVYAWDKTKPGGRGAKLSTTAPSGGKSENQQIIDRLKNKELVDRRRKDRTSEGLSPFDVGTYKSKTDVPETVTPLSGIGAWTAKGADVNRDHIPSGESLNRRGDSSAYSEGMTIAIPNPEMHRKFSPTFGGKQKSFDHISDSSGPPKKKRRVEIDTDHPQLGAYRDFKHMLVNTRGQDYSSSHPMLDLTKDPNRARQVGGYRRMHRLNAKIHGRKGKKRGYDPTAKGFNFTFDGAKSFTYTPSTQTVGKQMSDLFSDELQHLNQVKKV
ncbi:MAG: hypothetical protein AAGM22_23090 [Acidobacteriota bacterium]